MARRGPDPDECVACYGSVMVFCDDAVPDMFVHLTPAEGGVDARVSERTWWVLTQYRRGDVLVAFLTEVRDREGGYALAGPVFNQAASARGVRRRLRAA